MDTRKAFFVATAMAAAIFAAEGPVPMGIPHLDHVFIIMMENHVTARLSVTPTSLISTSSLALLMLQLIISSLLCGPSTECDRRLICIGSNVNKILATVDTNYGMHGVQSTKTYGHFSLHKSIEAGS